MLNLETAICPPETVHLRKKRNNGNRGKQLGERVVEVFGEGRKSFE
ncbi:MAG: hypothetical protein WA941_08980 [Nitrososphaeraceae archaeon]